MVILITIACIVAAGAFAWYFSGKILDSDEPKEVEETTEDELPAPRSWPRGGSVPFDQEREWRAPFGGRRI